MSRIRTTRCGVLITTNLIIYSKKYWKLNEKPHNREWGHNIDLLRKGGHAHMTESTSRDSLEKSAT